MDVRRASATERTACGAARRRHHEEQLLEPDDNLTEPEAGQLRDEGRETHG